MAETNTIPDALTVDVEEYFHATIFADVIPRKEWDGREGRSARSVETLLDLFAEWDVRSTFFVLGWFAERNRETVRRIAAAGHEVSSHGYEHRLVYEMGPERFREDIRRTKGLLEEIAGAPVRGYRAPTFSIIPRSFWAFEILAEEGYVYDSSIFPIRHDRYGVPSFPRFPVRLSFGDRSIVEFPLSTWKLGPWNLPVSGGGYLRQFPLPFIERGLRAIRKEGGVSVLYIHPWEIDAGAPRIPLSRLGTIRHYRGIEKMEGKLRRVVRGRPFAPMGEVIAALDPPDYDYDPD